MNWIKVNSPSDIPKDKKILLWDGSDAFIATYEDGYLSTCYCSSPAVGIVTHWHLLPEPPKDK